MKLYQRVSTYAVTHSACRPASLNRWSTLVVLTAVRWDTSLPINPVHAPEQPGMNIPRPCPRYIPRVAEEISVTETPGSGMRGMVITCLSASSAATTAVLTPTVEVGYLTHNVITRGYNNRLAHLHTKQKTSKYRQSLLLLQKYKHSIFPDGRCTPLTPKRAGAQPTLIPLRSPPDHHPIITPISPLATLLLSKPKKSNGNPCNTRTRDPVQSKPPIRRSSI